MNLILTGMPGAGKSTLGVLLAKALGMEFIDTDLLIQQSEGRLLQQIIDRDGVNRFMKIEEGVIAAIKADNAVIATGGSAVYYAAALHALRKGGRIVYLHVPFAEIERRITNITSRGIVLPNGVSLRALYDERVPLYRAVSDVAVNCAGRDIEQSVADIAALVTVFPPRTTA